MGAEGYWQKPLVDVADPHGRLARLSEDTKGDNFLDDLCLAMCLDTGKNFCESYKAVLKAMAGDSNFAGAGTAKGLLRELEGEQKVEAIRKALRAPGENAKLFGEMAGRCETKSSLNGCKCPAELAEGASHLTAWKKAFEKDTERLEAAILVDMMLAAERGPMSVGAAVSLVRQRGDIGPDGLEEVVRWYLETVRVKYRGDFELQKAQEKCGKCHKMKGEGEACPHCQQAQKALDEAREAEGRGNWDVAEKMAGKVLEIWTNHLEASDIRNRVREEKRKAQQEKEKREREKREAAEKAEQERKEALDRFKNALDTEEFAKAEGMIPELVRLKAGKDTDFRQQVDEAKGKKETRLVSACKKALQEANNALSGPAEDADIKGGEKGLNEAKKAYANLDQEFPKSAELKSFRDSIKKVEASLTEAKKKARVKGLEAAEGVTATGTNDGKPSVSVEWRPALSGTTADRWCVYRRVKGVGGYGIKLGETTGKRWNDPQDTQRAGEGEGLKIGVEYEYGVVPMVKMEGDRGTSEFKANEAAVAWSGAAVCRAKLTAGALDKSTGEGEAGQKGVVTLHWELPEGLDPSAESVELKLSRSDGRFKNVDVKGYLEYPDNQVETGNSYGYTLTLFIAGKMSGSSTKQVMVERLKPPEDVSGLRAKLMTSGRWLATWNWPEGVDRVLVVVSGPGSVSPESSWDTPDALSVKKQDYDRRNGWEVVLKPGMTKITVFAYKKTGGQRRCFSAGKSYPESGEGGGQVLKVERILWEMVLPQKKFWTFMTGRQQNAHSSATAITINIWAEGGGALPSLLVVAGKEGRPVRASDGATIAVIPAAPGGRASLTVPSGISPETIGVFYANPEADAEWYRLAPGLIR